MGKNKVPQMRKPTREEIQMQKKFAEENGKLHELCREFAEKLRDEGLMGQTLQGAGQVLNHKMQELLFKTKEFADWQKLKIRIDITPLKDLIIEE